MSQAQARIDFAQWLKNTHPQIFKRAVAIAENSTATLEGLGEETASEGFWSKFTKAAAGLGTTYLALKNQRDVMRINLARAQQGQPPIDAATSAPVVRTQVDMSPELTNRLVSTAGAGINKTLLLAGAAILAAFFIFKK
jgi:hypothetical protein